MPSAAAREAEASVLKLPFRTQMDGTPYAMANCGPTSVAMVLAYFGIEASNWDTRVLSMKTQGSWVGDPGGYSDSYGVFVQHLATVVQSYGLRTYGLWDRVGPRIDRLHQWTADDLRRAVTAGQPVIIQVRYRSMPGKASSSFPGDHYMVVHGFEGGTFIYSDPAYTGSAGSNLAIGEADLMYAMEAASAPRAAFATARPTTFASRPTLS